MKVRQDVVRKKLRARRDSRTAGGSPQGWKKPDGRGRMAGEDCKEILERSAGELLKRLQIPGWGARFDSACGPGSGGLLEVFE